MARSLWSELNDLSEAARAAVLEAASENDGEWSDRELERQYDEMLDECSEPCMIAGNEYQTSTALRLVDPVAYRCGYSDFLADDERCIEWHGRYFKPDALRDALDAEEAGAADETEDAE